MTPTRPPTPLQSPTPGRLIAVVGPSGVGKDSVMQALSLARPGLGVVRRAITRSADAGGEDFDALTEADFEAALARGDFVLHWQAHGLRYGIPRSVLDDLAQGRDMLANLSRAALAQAQALFPDFAVLCLTAPPDILARRLVTRGRETAPDRAARIARAGFPLPGGVGPVLTLDNAGPLGLTVTRALDRLYPVRA